MISYIGSDEETELPRRIALLGGTTTLSDCAIALRYLLDQRHLVAGPEVAKYEQAFAQHIGVRYAYSFASGRLGLYGILKALGVGPGAEVLIQVPTHVVVANAIRYVGARPVFVDCRLDSYNMDFEDAERRVSPRTKVLVLQHTFGIPSDLDATLSFTRRHNLHLIEDCVHALGATFDGRQVGSFGKAAFFSSEETKTITTTMGGMAVTDDYETASHIQAFQARCAWPTEWLTTRYLVKFILYHFLTEPRIHGFARWLYELLGRRQPAPAATTEEERRGERPRRYEQRLSNAQAALGLRQILRLDQNVAHRAAIASEYGRQLSKYFSPPESAVRSRPAILRYPVWVEERAAALLAAAPYAVLGTWFTSVLEEAVSPAHGGYEKGSCPQAEAAMHHLVNLPTHGRVREADAKRIARALLTLASSSPS